MQIFEGANIGALTTFEVGGTARELIELQSAAELPAAIEHLRRRRRPWWLLGEGSNVLVDDGDLEGAVLRLRDERVDIEELDGGLAVFATAGVNWDRLVERAVVAGAGGIECMSGIPGSCGAAPLQNIGAYGQELADTLVAVDVFDLRVGDFARLPAEACGFGYRTSYFKTEWLGRYIVTGIHLALPFARRGLTSYKDLARYFADAPAPPTPGQVREAVLSIRRDKAMVRDPHVADCRSAGSFFTNPHLSNDAFAALRRRAESRGLFVPAFPMGELTKVPAAWLIEKSGTVKGEREGGAAVSSRHVLALTNFDNATCDEVLRLAERIRQRVHDAWGIALEMEPRRITLETGIVPDEYGPKRHQEKP